MTIRLENVSFRYPGATAHALDRITTSFAPNSVTLVTGPLGAGCSTLLLVAGGLAPHVTGGDRAGRVTVLGADPAEPGSRRALAGRIGLLLPTPVTQLSRMAPTVAEELAFGPANLGWACERIWESVDVAMKQVGVAHLRDRVPSTLSGGELQRVMFAAVVALQPEVYLLDEPATELDPLAAESLYDLLPVLARSATVIIASTDVDRLAERVDRVVLLRQGNLVADGVPAEVLGAEPALSARCGTTVAEIARDAGIPASRFPVTVAELAAEIGS